MIRSSFSAAHRLMGYDGKCEAIHGHNWKVDIVVKARELDETGIAMDFRIIKEKAKEILDTLDHSFLNELPFFQNDNPSSENIAKYIYKQLSNIINTDRVSISKVSAWESDTACASYFEEE
jgi:6-pyruvoyltetrahydropterin/6-carboxytetrahydropterin synthase